MARIQLIAIPVSIALLALVLRSVDLGKVLSIVGHAQPAFLIAGVASVSLELLFKSIKLKIIASTQAKCSLGDAAVVYLIGIPFGEVTPGKAGDLLKLYNLSRRTNLPLASSFAVGVLDKALDLVATVVLAAAGILFLVSRQAIDRMVLSTLALSILTILLFIVIFSQRGILSLLRLLYKRLAPPPLRASLEGGMEGFYGGITSIIRARGSLVLAMFFAFLACFAISTRAFLLGQALGLEVPLPYFVLLIPIIIIAEALPISILGIGTREYTTIWLFSAFGVSSEHAFSLSLLAFVTILTTLVLPGYVIMYVEHHFSRRVSASQPETDPRE